MAEIMPLDCWVSFGRIPWVCVRVHNPHRCHNRMGRSGAAQRILSARPQRV